MMQYRNERTGVIADLSCRPARGWEPIKASSPADKPAETVKKPAKKTTKTAKTAE